MKKTKQIILVLFIGMLVIPTIGIGLAIQHDQNEKTIGIVYSDDDDYSIHLAIQTIEKETRNLNIDTHRTNPYDLNLLSQNVDFVVIIGHGTPEGLETRDGIIAWHKLYDDIASINPKKTIVLACNSPSD